MASMPAPGPLSNRPPRLTHGPWVLEAPSVTELDIAPDHPEDLDDKLCGDCNISRENWKGGVWGLEY